MVIQTDFYPGAGYQQQGYAIYQQQGVYTTDDYDNDNAWGVETKPGPCFTTPQHSSHQMVYDGGHAQQQDGWHSTNKHQNGRHGTSEHYSQGYGGQALSHNFDTSQFSDSGKFKNPTPITDCKTYHQTQAYTVDAVRYVPRPQIPYNQGPCGPLSYPTATTYKEEVWTVKKV